VDITSVIIDIRQGQKKTPYTTPPLKDEILEDK
jgi:hypothetical protein